ncbi:MAG: PolC-type DNA polymerase III [Fusobacteria bacterium]|nr:PolC-type DNA polymerase III [Fusobacteriota bacterium]
MKKFMRIKPKDDLFNYLKISNVCVDEVCVFFNEKEIEMNCILKNCDGFKELEIIENDFKRKLGDDFNLKFNLNYENRDGKLSDCEKKIIVDNIVEEVKKYSVLAKAYLNFYNYDINDSKICFTIPDKIGVEKLLQNNIDKKLENLFKNFMGNNFLVNLQSDCNIDNFECLKEAIQNQKNLEEDKLQVNITNLTSKKTETKEKKDDKNPNIIYGKEIKIESSTYEKFEDLYAGDTLAIEGEVFKKEDRDLSNGGKLVSFNITDGSDSITVKVFLKSSEENLNFKNGQFIKIRGKKQPDKFSMGEDVIFASDITLLDTKKRKREDNSSVKRVELHTHTKMSELDSVADVKDLIDIAAYFGHKSIAITDHGVVHAFPAAYDAAKKHSDFKVIFGCEGYLVDDEIKMVIKPKDIPIEEEIYTVFDIETTGFDPYNDMIIEIGAVKIKGHTEIATFSSFVNPKMKIPKHIIELTGISDDMVIDAPEIEEVLEKFYEFIGDDTLVAHNAMFDTGFIRQKLTLLNKKLENPIIDTLLWSRNILKDLKKHNLKAVSEYLQVDLVGHHRAVHDAKATAEIFMKLVNQLIRDNIYKLTEIDDAFENNIKQSRPLHIILLAQNLVGLKNLYEIISTSHIDYFHRTPRIPKSYLKTKREGLIIGSACESGELIQAYLKGKSDNEIKDIAKFYDYLEIQPNSNNMFMIDAGLIKSEDELKIMNKYIYDLGKELDIPVVATGDVHYINREDYIYRSILLYGRGFKDFDRDSGLYLKTTDEMLDEFKYLGVSEAYEVVVENTNKISNMIEKIKPIPDGFYPPKLDGAEEQVREMSYEKAHKIYGEVLPEIVEKRLERELEAIIGNSFAVLYLIAHKLVKKSLDDGYIVGSRGSVGSSLVAYMMDITEVNALYPHYICPQCKYNEFMDYEGCGVDLPDKDCPKCNTQLKKEGHTIPFEVFMGFNGDKVPDIDLNFSSEYQMVVHKYTEELFGKENVFRAGTISTLAERNAFGYVKKYVDENNIKKRRAEMERLASNCENVRKTTGQHPGGMIVLPHGSSIYEFTPVQKPANDMKSDSITTHFDYHVMDEQLVKLDILGHENPTTIKFLQDYTGLEIDDIPLADEKTISIFSSTDALGVTPEQIGSTVGTYGVPEFGTPFVRQMLIDTKPTTFSELVRISGLSHGTDVWLNNAQEYVRAGVATLSEIITVRDDIMNYLIDSGLEKGTAFSIMEFVRKGQPTKNPEKWEEYANIMREHNVKDWYIESCKKIKYMFPKGHAVAYVMMATRIAYFKVHYPIHFYAAFLTRKAEDFDVESMFADINTLVASKKEFEQIARPDVREKNVLVLLEVLVEMYYRGIELLGVDIYESEAKQFKIEGNKIRIPLIGVAGLGDSVVENIIKERLESKFLSIEDFVRRTKTSKTVVEKLKEYNAIVGLSETNQKKLF